jgi:hypothetical protein
VENYGNTAHPIGKELTTERNVPKRLLSAIKQRHATEALDAKIRTSL